MVFLNAYLIIDVFFLRERESVPFVGARDTKDTKNLGNAPSHPTLFSARARTCSRRCHRRRCSRPPSLCTRSHFLRSSSTRTRFEIEFLPIGNLLSSGVSSSSSSPSLSPPRSNEQRQQRQKTTRAKKKTFCSSSPSARERAREETKEEERPVPRAEETCLFFYVF